MYPEAYIKFLANFHGPRDYFECHEILEEHWKSEREKRQLWVGLIQLAVSLYHQRRGNYSGAYRMMESAIKILEGESLGFLSIDQEALLQMMRARLDDILHKRPYYSLNLPITDHQLIAKCINLCEQMGYEWGNAAQIHDEKIVHKHRVRDRSSVINERKRQLQMKRLSREGKAGQQD